MRFTPDFLDEIKQRNRIEEVISQNVQLKRSGSNLAGLCPFHNEKTPSFVVFSRSESFYCFGCGAGGDVVGYVMRMEGLQYHEAVEYLAKRCGLPMPEQTDIKPSDSVRRDRVLEMNRIAAKFYHEALYKPENKEGLEYLNRRGLTNATIKHFGLGYADKSWTSLSEHLKKNGFTDREMVAGFLAGRSGERTFNYFRGRVMFPIIDTGGNIVAFGGRAIGDEKPKYINSSDTPAFKKSKNLFALNFAKVKADKGLILCEGYMDVISLHQSGFVNAVATLGTAINQEHARVVQRFTNTVFLAYDSDAAGKKATDRAISVLSQAGITVKVIDLGNSKDPDEFIKNNGKEAFSLKLNETKGRIDYQIEEITKKYNRENPDQLQECSRELIEFISTIYDRATREIYCGRTSSLLGLSYDAIFKPVEAKNAIKAANKKRERDAIDIRQAAGYRNQANPNKVRFSDVAAVEERIIGILLLMPELIGAAMARLTDEDFNTAFCKKVFLWLKECFNSNKAPVISANEQFTLNEQSELARYVADRQLVTDNSEQVLDAHITSLHEKNERRRADSISVDNIDALGEYLKSLKNKKK